MHRNTTNAMECSDSVFVSPVWLFAACVFVYVFGVKFLVKLVKGKRCCKSQEKTVKAFTRGSVWRGVTETSQNSGSDRTL